MRPGRCFRVILNAERHPGRIPDSFQRVIIEVDVCNLGISRKAVAHNMESMILGCDLNAAVQQVFNRLIDSMMSEFELGGSCADSLREQLSPEAYPEYRHRLPKEP